MVCLWAGHTIIVPLPTRERLSQLSNTQAFSPTIVVSESSSSCDQRSLSNDPEEARHYASRLTFSANTAATTDPRISRLFFAYTPPFRNRSIAARRVCNSFPATPPLSGPISDHSALTDAIALEPCGSSPTPNSSSMPYPGVRSTRSPYYRRPQPRASSLQSTSTQSEARSLDVACVLLPWSALRMWQLMSYHMRSPSASWGR